MQIELCFYWLIMDKKQCVREEKEHKRSEMKSGSILLWKINLRIKFSFITYLFIFCAHFFARCCLFVLFFTCLHNVSFVLLSAMTFRWTFSRKALFCATNRVLFNIVGGCSIEVLHIIQNSWEQNVELNNNSNIR